MDTELVIDFVLSQRGQQMLVVNDYKFKKKRVLKSGNISWRCATVPSCKAMCYTEEGKKYIIIIVLQLKSHYF